MPPQPQEGLTEGGRPARPSRSGRPPRVDWTRALVQPAPDGPHRLAGDLHLVDAAGGPVLVDLASPVPFWDRSRKLAAAAAAADLPFAEPIVVRNRAQVPTAWRHAILLGYPGAWLRAGDRGYAAGAADPGWAPLPAASGVYRVVDYNPVRGELVCGGGQGGYFTARVLAAAGYAGDPRHHRVRLVYWPGLRSARFAVVKLPEGLL